MKDYLQVCCEKLQARIGAKVDFSVVQDVANRKYKIEIKCAGVGVSVIADDLSVQVVDDMMRELETGLMRKGAEAE